MGDIVCVEVSENHITGLKDSVTECAPKNELVMNCFAVLLTFV